MDHIDSVERGEDSFITEINLVLSADDCDQFSNRIDVATSDGQVVNLSGDEHLPSVIGAMVQATLMCGRLETVAVKHLVDEPFPQSTGLRVSLQGMLHGEHMVEWHLFVISEKERTSRRIDDRRGRRSVDQVEASWRMRWLRQL